jgi:hypothetical protein
MLGLMVLVAHVLENLFARRQIQKAPHFPRAHIGAGIVDRDLDLEVPEVWPPIAMVTSSGGTVQSDRNVSGSSTVVASYSDPREWK